MTRVRMLAVALVAILLGLWGGTQLAATASGGGTPNPIANAPGPMLFTSHGGAKNVYIQSDNLTLSLPGGSVPVGPAITAVCPGTSGNCTFELDGNIQYGGSSTSGNAYAIAFQVDGSFLPQGPSGGAVPLAGAGYYATTGWNTQATGLKHGTHTVRLYAYTLAAATAADYSLIVRVYKP